MSIQTAFKASYPKPIGWHSAPRSCVRVTFTRGDTHWPGRPKLIALLCTCLVVVMLTEIDCIVELITRDLDAGLIDSFEKRILICGEWGDVAPLLDRMMSSGLTQKLIPNLLIAAKYTDLFISNYFGKVQLQIIDWNESAYEGQLIERVRTSRHGYRITLAIDYEPTPRRLSRIQALLERNGTLVIPHERPTWRFRFPELLRRFSDSGGAFIKLNEILSTARANRLMRLRLQDDGSNLFQISRTVLSMDEFYRTR
ncbi:hypothetical protein EG68_06608 [Paragonimus skrjabini miyazakii]|uniref:Uncharacterized protein n=1 Tax=Paragonimus skrjabini miyazakii TaxID=59628 RepID=A0A8S9YSP6_9TREM|nr:hypothetical protein EG68_06608 [Paragonimus skrjabini miyazakii]